MDRLLTGGVPKSERQAIKKKMLDLVDIYYLALDAPKEGNKVTYHPGLINSVLDHPHVVYHVSM
jgi:RNA-dependent RNA polymerase